VFFRNRQDNIKFPVCFLETVEVIVFTLTVYAVTVKKIQNRQKILKPSGNFEFPVVTAGS
jgi:hypothetical protein